MVEIFEPKLFALHNIPPFLLPILLAYAHKKVSAIPYFLYILKNRSIQIKRLIKYSNIEVVYPIRKLINNVKKERILY